MNYAKIITLLCLFISTAVWIPVSARDSESVLMFAGQSREEFSSYINDVCKMGKECALPYGAAFYTSLDAQGFDTPHSNAPGDNHQDMWFLSNVYPGLAVQIGLWLGPEQLPAIANGQYKSKIDALANKLGKLNQDIYLRIGYEFDGPHNRYSPIDYIKAYKVIAKRMRNEQNVILVWHSYAMKPTYQERDISEWYPGDDYVDWIGLSFFQVTDEGYHTGPNRDNVIRVAQRKNKPVMIGEASAIRYTARQKSLSGEAYWKYWYQPFFDFIESNKEIKAVSMINVNWDSQKQHAVLDWGDSRITADEFVLKNWRKKLAENYWKFSDNHD